MFYKRSRSLYVRHTYTSVTNIYPYEHSCFLFHIHRRTHTYPYRICVSEKLRAKNAADG